MVLNGVFPSTFPETEEPRLRRGSLSPTPRATFSAEPYRNVPITLRNDFSGYRLPKITSKRSVGQLCPSAHPLVEFLGQPLAGQLPENHFYLNDSDYVPSISRKSCGSKTRMFRIVRRMRFDA